MKKRTVVLCELCEEDRLAATVVHWGLCGDHVAQVGAAPANGKKTSYEAYERRIKNGRLHKKCGREIDARGWTRHVAACKGKVKA